LLVTEHRHEKESLNTLGVLPTKPWSS